jgi:predicted MFS family arabinose efflux permease
MVIFTSAFQPLVNRVGFGWTLRIFGFIILAALLASLLLLKQRPTPQKPRAILDFGAFREARFNIFAASSILMFAGAYTPFYYIAVFGQQELGISERMSYNMLAIAGAGSTLGRLFPAVAARKYGALPVFALCVFICGMLQFIWGAVHNLGGLICFSLAYGFFGGAVAGTAPVACIEMSPNIHIAGTRVGMLLLIGSIGVLVGNPIGGAILNTKSGFEGLEAFGGTVLLASSVLIVVSYEMLMKWRRSESEKDV